MSQTNIPNQSDLERLVAAGSHDVYENLDWIRSNVRRGSGGWRGTTWESGTPAELGRMIREYGKSLREVDPSTNAPVFRYVNRTAIPMSSLRPGQAQQRQYEEYLELFPEVEAQLVAEGFEPLPDYEAPEPVAPEPPTIAAREPDDVDAAIGLLFSPEPTSSEEETAVPIADIDTE